MQTTPSTSGVLENARGRSADGSIVFIGTATTLIRYAGFTILTDPNFIHAGDHVHIGYGLRAKRLTNPAIEIEDLPPLDCVVLSHFHGDHFDQVAQARLDKSLPIVTTRHAAGALRSRGFSAAKGLETWQRSRFARNSAQLMVTAMPGKHGPGIMTYALPPVMGSILDFSDGRNNVPPLRIYISGDTLLHKDLREIPKRFTGIHIGLFHLGGTRVMGVMLTMDARQGLRAVRRINPDVAIPIHYDDYNVFRSPLRDFQKEVDDAGMQDRVAYLGRGQTYEFSITQ
ncbi:MAG: MBL fold metallo-hydrolase [Candidatus Eremiobacteraeota bacterium]|nr:MBL fold metallo-hydrolase [Candidatus Eremiobacteraeota bacterium]